MNGPVKWISAGLGGYAGAICETLTQLSAEPNPPVKLLAVCEPAQDLHAAKIAELRAAGVKVFADFDQLLAEPAEAVWIPVPIDLHRPFFEKAAAAGKTIVCEKPAAGSIDDLDSMIAARDKHSVKATIAFYDVFEELPLKMKRELVGGAIGNIQSAVLTACWPRGAKYFGRSPWAGKYQRNGVWVMDSLVNNALAHYVNLALFLLGKTDTKMAEPTAIEAELYRANPIESFDTCSLRVSLEGQVPLLILMTHASETTEHPKVEIIGDAGRLRFEALGETLLDSRGRQTIVPAAPDSRPRMVRKLSRWVRGEGSDHVTSLEMARPQLVVANGASEATAVRTIDENSVDTFVRPDGDQLRFIPGIEKTIADLAAKGQMLHESGRYAWTAAAGKMNLTGYRHFSGPR